MTLALALVSCAERAVIALVEGPHTSTGAGNASAWHSRLGHDQLMRYHTGEMTVPRDSPWPSFEISSIVYTHGMGPNPGHLSQPEVARKVAVEIIRQLQAQGHTAYLAGGCVRDRLLGLEAKDHDVATDATPGAVQRQFPRTQAVGEAFGVVLVHLRGFSIEVATFRREWDYRDGRRPSQVVFSDAEHDARRRDFTVNGLFEDPIKGVVIDFVDGRSDLKEGLIRAIGDPVERFAEDFLRMLRAARFAARLGFRIESATARAIRKHASQLAIISRERIGQELKLMLTGVNRTRAARVIQGLHLDHPTLDESHLTAPLPTLGRLEPSATFATTLAAWALDRHVMSRLRSGKPYRSGKLVARQAKHRTVRDLLEEVRAFAKTDVDSLVGRWRGALRLTNSQCDSMRGCLRLLPEVLTWSELPVSRRKRIMADTSWSHVFALASAICWPSHAALVRAIKTDAPMLHAQGVCPPRLVTGDDLIKLGRKPGPEFGRILDEVYDAQLEGTIRSRDEAISWLMQNAE